MTNTDKTNRQFDAVMASCRDIFDKKGRDYGASWRIMRPSTLTDQILIKARRLRQLETDKAQVAGEDNPSEWRGIINYAIMALIQMEKSTVDTPDVDADQALALYDKVAAENKALMKAKNHDYGEAWRQMRVSSFTDIILTKLQRIKEIEDNDGHTIVSEGPEGNYRDIIIYAVFALIKLDEQSPENP